MRKRLCWRCVCIRESVSVYKGVLERCLYQRCVSIRKVSVLER